MKNILIVEDDTALNNGIVLSLSGNEYNFYKAYTINEAKYLIIEKDFDLIILDINLPDGKGLDLCREIRRTSSIPIIFLTANDMEIDVVTGLEIGGDDYITKPFSLSILRARVKAVLRRKGNNNINVYEYNDFRFDFENMNFHKGSLEVELSKTEQRLLKLLIVNKNNILPRTRLIDSIWTNNSEYVDENALSVSIRRLRNKLEDKPNKPKYIKTVYGVGYIWDERANSKKVIS